MDHSKFETRLAETAHQSPPSAQTLSTWTEHLTNKTVHAADTAISGLLRAPPGRRYEILGDLDGPVACPLLSLLNRHLCHLSP